MKILTLAREDFYASVAIELNSTELSGSRSLIDHTLLDH